MHASIAAQPRDQHESATILPGPMSRTPARDFPCIEEQLHRFGSAMMLCFTAAVLVCLFVVNARGRITADLLLARQ